MAIVLGNIGYGKLATQTGQYLDLSADRALDGRGFTTDQGYCAHPEAGVSSNAHWMVDLGKTHQILNVTIYNTRDVGGTLPILYIYLMR